MRRLLSRDSSILNFPLQKTKNFHCFEACYQTFKVFMASQESEMQILFQNFLLDKFAFLHKAKFLF